MTTHQPIKFLLTFCFLIFFSISFSQVPNWDWAKRGFGDNRDQPNSITSDAAGNVYVAGSFMSTTLTYGIYFLVLNSNEGKKTRKLVKLKE